MSQLTAKGYDIQWNIVVLGDDTTAANASRYASLAQATGGSFLMLKGKYNERAADVNNFINSMRSSTDHSNRYKKQKQYELEANSGRAHKFGWYKSLPPTDKK